MKNISYSLIVAIAFAVFCSWMRGGIQDAPIVLIIFFIVGFFGSFFLFWLLKQNNLLVIEGVFEHIPYSSVVRNITAFVIAITTFFWAGRTILYGGYAGWLIAFFLWLIAPLVVSLVAKKYVVVLAAITNISILLSSFREDARHWASSSDFWDMFWRRDVYAFAVVILIAISFSLIVSIPIYLLRRKTE